MTASVNSCLFISSIEIIFISLFFPSPSYSLNPPLSVSNTHTHTHAHKSIHTYTSAPVHIYTSTHHFFKVTRSRDFWKLPSALSLSLSLLFSSPLLSSPP